MLALEPVVKTNEKDEGKTDETDLSISLPKTYLCSLPVLLSCLAIGFVNSYPAPATEDMRRPGSRMQGITEDEITWVASIPLIAGVAGSACSGFAAQYFGRKGLLFFCALVHFGGWMAIANAPTVPIIYLGRVLCGFCCGCVVVAGPAYLVEITPTEIRGRMSALFSVSISLGMTVVMAMGVVLRWAWLAVAGACVVVVAAFLLLLVPESPPWLVNEKRLGDAAKGLKCLRKRGADVNKETRDMAEGQAKCEKQKNRNFQLKEIFHRTFYKPCGISLALMVFNAFSGKLPVMVYTVDIFQKTGSPIPPNIASTILAVAQLLGMILSSILMDRTGRRRLYITSGFFVTASLVCVGIYSYIVAKDPTIDSHKFGWIPFLCLLTFAFSFSLGLGPVPLVMCPEISPLRSRSVILGVSTFALSVFSFVVVKMYHAMIGALGLYGLYFFYSFFSFSSMVFAYFVMPETKGLSLQEIQTLVCS